MVSRLHQILLDNDAETWFAPLITFGEMAVGLGLLFGCLTGFAAFFGALMNMSFLLAGSASTNPVLFTLAIGLILAWKVAGYYGVDRYLLPMLGTPWHPGAIRVETPSQSVAPKPSNPPRVQPRSSATPPPGRQTRGRSNSEVTPTAPPAASQSSTPAARRRIPLTPCVHGRTLRPWA